MAVNFNSLVKISKKLAKIFNSVNFKNAYSCIIDKNGKSFSVKIKEEYDISNIKNVWPPVKTQDVQINIISSIDNLWLHAQRAPDDYITLTNYKDDNCCEDITQNVKSSINKPIIHTCINIGKYFSCLDKPNDKVIFWIGVEVTDENDLVFLYVNSDIIKVQLDKVCNAILDKNGVYKINVEKFTTTGEFYDVLETILIKTLHEFLKAIY